MASALDRLNSAPSGSGAINAAGFTNGLPAADNQTLRSDGTGGAVQGSDVLIADAAASSVTVSTTAGTALVVTATANAATTGASQVGKGVSITAPPAVASTDTAGAAVGGNVTITAGAAARFTSGNATGGNVYLIPGAGIGTSLAGVIGLFGTTSSFPGLKQRAGSGQVQLTLADGTGRSTLWAGAVAIGGTVDNFGANDVYITQSGGSAISAIGLRSNCSLGWVSAADASQSSDTRISRSAAGVLSLDTTANVNGLGKLLYSVLTEDNTAGSGSPNILLAAETNSYFTNTGASAQNYHTLPVPVVGLQYTFVVTDADGIRVTATNSATIRIGGIVTAANGHIDSTTIGDTVTLVAFSTTSWVATALVGGGALFAPGWTAT